MLPLSLKKPNSKHLHNCGTSLSIDELVPLLFCLKRIVEVCQFVAVEVGQRPDFVEKKENTHYI
jgi:hypothetical protein